LNIKRIIAATAVAAVASVGFAASASAETFVSDTSVPGHVKQERQGKVVNHYTQQWTDPDTGVVYEYIVNTLGDFGGDPRLNDGIMLNVVRGSDGSVSVWRFVHESHPSYTGEGTPIWGSWEYKIDNNVGVQR
jgi:hypothetical protein